MTVYVLVIIMAAWNGQPAAAMHDFTSKATCENAAAEIRTAVVFGTKADYRVICVPK